MQELIIDFLKAVNIAELLAIGGMFWFFYNRLDKKIEKLEEKTDKLAQKVEDIDKRLCRIEGSLSTQGHCLFNQNKSEQKAL
jgi:hypothetical protein